MPVICWIKETSNRFTTRVCNMVLRSLERFDDYLHTQGMCEDNPWVIRCVPEHLITKGLCEKAVEDNPWDLMYLPEHLKTNELCEKAVENSPRTIRHVPGHLKTKEMCKKVVEKGPWNLEYVPD